jgi:hypothetical protein
MIPKWSVLISLVIAILAAASFGQTVITLCGTVTNATGAPVPGATIKLQKKNLTAVSASDGKYCINWNAGVSLRPLSGPPVRRCELSGKRLTVTLSGGDRFSASMFDTRGRTLWTIAHPQWTAGRHDVLLPMTGFSDQSGLLQVTVGPSRLTFKFTRCGERSFMFSHVNAVAPSPDLAKSWAPSAAMPVLDTLVATGQGFARNNAIRSFVYQYVDTIDFALGEPDTFSEARQQIVHRVNDFRSTVGIGRLLRNKAMEACVDTQAQLDYTSKTAHSAFGHCKESAQNECPGWKSSKMLTVANIVIVSCLQMMWDEGAPPAGTPCGGGTACYSQHGHYINMTSTAYSKVAGGFFYNPADSTMWAAHDFFR